MEGPLGFPGGGAPPPRGEVSGGSGMGGVNFTSPLFAISDLNYCVTLISIIDDVTEQVGPRSALFLLLMDHGFRRLERHKEKSEIIYHKNNKVHIRQ